MPHLLLLLAYVAVLRVLLLGGVATTLSAVDCPVSKTVGAVARSREME